MDWLAVERAGGRISGGAEAYATNLKKIVTPTADMSETLRLRRKAGIVSGYYRHQGTWVKLASKTAPRLAQLAITVNSPGTPPPWGGQTALAAFDNFHATADSVDCRGFPRPPRRRGS